MALTGSQRRHRPSGHQGGQTYASLARLLLDRAQGLPDSTAYEFLHSDGTVDTISYGTLYERAAEVAAQVALGGDRPGPVLLLYPPGLGFVTALWGCLLAGAPAVPAYPPLPRPGDRGTIRFRHILADVRPSHVLVDPFIRDVLADIDAGPVLPSLLCPDPGTAVGGEAGRPTAFGRGQTIAAPPRVLPGTDDVALVQYTSGSTSDPKGVVLRHSNLLHNMRAITEVFGLNEDTRAVSWLPPYHDMGLIGCILTPVLVGFPIRLMSPLDFLKSPLSWLRQISTLQVTAAGGPNFAYDLCVRRARNEDLQDLDLSSWKVAFNGAEPVQRRTMEEFARRFAPHGFRPSAFLPCYGLAEATLIATGHHWDPTEPDDTPAPGAAPRVSCGPAAGGTSVAVVDPADGRPLSDGEEGEIWLRGPSITDGYWNGTGASRTGSADRPGEAFGDRSGELFGDLDGLRHLRTGDLGYLRDGELFVTGRRKDVLVHRGVNHHAHDIESAAVRGNPHVRPTAAAFMVEDPEPVVVLAVERPPARAGTDEETARVLRTRVLEATGVRLDVVVLCAPRAIPKTTSGKVQRTLARDRFLAGELDGAVTIGAPTGLGGGSVEPNGSGLADGDRGSAAASASASASGPSVAEVAEPLSTLVAGVFAGVCEVPECGTDQRLADIGGDSIRAAEIAAIVERAMDLPVPIESVLATATPDALARHLLTHWAEQGVGTPSVLGRLEELSMTAPEGTTL